MSTPICSFIAAKSATGISISISQFNAAIAAIELREGRPFWESRNVEDDDEDDDDYFTAGEETDEDMKARGAMDGDGFVVCGTCGKGGGAHATEDCPDQEQWSLECYSCDALLGGKVFDNEKEYDDCYAAAHFTAAGEWLCEKCK